MFLFHIINRVFTQETTINEQQKKQISNINNKYQNEKQDNLLVSNKYNKKDELILWDYTNTVK